MATHPGPTWRVSRLHQTNFGCRTRGTPWRVLTQCKDMSTTPLLSPPAPAQASQLAPALAHLLGEDRYQLWFGQCQFSWNEGNLTVLVPAQFHKERILKSYMEPLREAAQETLGEVQSIRVTLGRGAPAARTNDSASIEQPITRKDPPVREDLSQAPPTPRPRMQQHWKRLEDFVVGPCNRLAYQAAVNLLKDVDLAPRLITLFGPAGVGKTHLLEGLYTALRQHAGEGPAVLYLSAEDFTNRFLGSLNGNQMTGFRRQFRDAGALLVDKIHFLAGKKSSQEEFLHTLDTLGRLGRPVVVTSDKHPKCYAEAMPQLADRLIGGGCWPVDLPDPVTRLNMLQAKSEAMKLPMTKDVMQYLADRMRGNVRELEGVLHTVRHYAQVHQEPVTLNLAREAIAGQFPEQGKMTTLPQLELLVCKQLGLEPTRLHENTRARAVSYPRMLVMYLARRLAGASYGEIGRFYGAKSHTTAIAAERKIAKLLADDAPLFANIDRCPVRDIIEAVERELFRA
jgi:chromosomal replication initiator protein